MFSSKKFGVLVFFCLQCWRYNFFSHSYLVTALNGIDFQYLLDDVSLCIKRNSSSEEIEIKGSGKKSKKKKTVNKKKMFALFYGYYAVEVINAISNDQISKLILLTNCLGEEEALRDIIVNLTTNSSEFTSPEYHRYLRHISNTSSDLKISTTYLNGFLQLLLPDVHRSILTAANLGIRKAHWNSEEGQKDASIEYPDIDELGIRTIQLHTIDISGMADYQEKLRQKVIERENSGVVSFGGPKPPPPPLPKLQELLLDPDTEEFAAQYLTQHYSSSSRSSSSSGYAQRIPAGDEVGEGVVERGPDEVESDGDGDGSTYTLFFLLNERSDFVGGEVWVSNRDDEDMDGDDSFDLNATVVKAPHGSLVTKFTPEKGSLVLTHSGSGRPHGHGPLVVGRRSMLVVELWPFKDAPPGSRRPALAEAVSFSPSHDFRLEL